jgi:hypothetical protein
MSISLPSGDADSRRGFGPRNPVARAELIRERADNRVSSQRRLPLWISSPLIPDELSVPITIGASPPRAGMSAQLAGMFRASSTLRSRLAP